VPVAKLFKAFTTARTRAKWLPDKVTVRSTNENSRIRFVMADDTSVEAYFTAKGDKKSAVAIAHQKLPDKAAADRIKTWWTERFDALSEILG
jgi:uncharacterized protein YndB with AHSA1/START domain